MSIEKLLFRRFQQLLLFYVQVYSQGKGNLIAVEDTHFVRNQAKSAGSAVMCQTFAYVQSRHTSYSYNFSDWYDVCMNRGGVEMVNLLAPLYAFSK